MKKLFIYAHRDLIHIIMHHWTLKLRWIFVTFMKYYIIGWLKNYVKIYTKNILFSKFVTKTALLLVVWWRRNCRRSSRSSDPWTRSTGINRQTVRWALILWRLSCIGRLIWGRKLLIGRLNFFIRFVFVVSREIIDVFRHCIHTRIITWNFKYLTSIDLNHYGLEWPRSCYDLGTIRWSFSSLILNLNLPRSALFYVISKLTLTILRSCSCIMPQISGIKEPRIHEHCNYNQQKTTTETSLNV